MSDEKNKAYEKLTPERKALVDTILQNLEKGDGLWKQGWVNTGVPESAIRIRCIPGRLSDRPAGRSRICRRRRLCR